MITEKLIINEVTMEVFKHPERCNSDDGERCYYLIHIIYNSNLERGECEKYKTQLKSVDIAISKSSYTTTFLKCKECINDMIG